MPAASARGWIRLAPVLLVALVTIAGATLLAVLALRLVDTWAGPVTPLARIDTIAVDGSGLHTLLQDAHQEDWGPAWSPDGRTLAFTLITPGRNDNQIVLVDSNGGNRHQLTHNDRGNYLIAWSPDSRRLAYLTQQGDDVRTSELAVVNTDGIDARQLTHNTTQEYGASWSPDGRRIAFGSQQDGTWRVYVMNVDGDGGDVQPVAGTDQGNAPSWSPDGRTIAFTSNRTGNDTIYTVDATGGEPHRLTQGTSHNDNAVWSPDGTRIAFSSDRDGTNDLWVMNADGSDPVNLTHGAHVAIDIPTWAPDSQHLAFLARSIDITKWSTRVLRGVVILVHAAVIAWVVLAVLVRWSLPRGFLTLLAVLTGGLFALFRREPVLLPAALAAGLLADGCVWWLHPDVTRRGALVLVAVVIPVALYAPPLLALGRTDSEAWPLPMVLGLTVLVSVSGLLVAVGLLQRTRSRGVGG